MIDRENVITDIVERIEATLAVDSEYVTIPLDLLQYALSMLKEQETKWIHRADMDYKDKNGVVHFHGMCESCGFIHDFIDGHTGQYKFCPECGRSVK